MKCLTGYTTENSHWEYIILHYRLPKAITAVNTGIGLSISGLLMQTLFKNPLAGPSVLGITSGASLGVALLIFGSAFATNGLAILLQSSLSLIAVATIGAAIVMLLLLLITYIIRDTMAVLVIGMMIGSLTNAIVSTLIYYSTAEELQKFSFWSMGSISNLTNKENSILTICIFVGTLLSFFAVKPLNALLLGENYARSIGLNFTKTRVLLLFTTCILAGSVTAFVGPIGFIGLAVPHIAKIILKTSDHYKLLVGTLFLGAASMLFCDSLSQLVGNNNALPINVITALFGAPIVIWLLLKNQKTSF